MSTYAAAYDESTNETYFNTQITDISQGGDIIQSIYTEAQRKNNYDSNTKLNNEQQRDLAYFRGNQAETLWDRFSDTASTSSDSKASNNWNNTYSNSSVISTGINKVNSADTNYVKPRVYAVGRDLAKFPIGTHSLRLYIPDDQDKFVNKDGQPTQFAKELGIEEFKQFKDQNDKIQYGVTVAGFEDNNLLVQEINNKNDIEATQQWVKAPTDKSGLSPEAILIKTPKGVSDTEHIVSLMKKEQELKQELGQKNVKYELFSENCNTVTRYILDDKIDFKGFDPGSSTENLKNFKDDLKKTNKTIENK